MLPIFSDSVRGAGPSILPGARCVVEPPPAATSSLAAVSLRERAPASAARNMSIART
ncbi:Uncharacterised protein [Mycobacteroides abscessus subsp. abscessus]|nr:Uncharacterised protein [Mycobacteroides abscessus subsp. abscessus]